jgi:hypothetical protein
MSYTDDEMLRDAITEANQMRTERDQLRAALKRLLEYDGDNWRNTTYPDDSLLDLTTTAGAVRSAYSLLEAKAGGR